MAGAFGKLILRASASDRRGGVAHGQGAEGGEQIRQDFFRIEIADDAQFEVAFGEFGREPFVGVGQRVG